MKLLPFIVILVFSTSFAQSKDQEVTPFLERLVSQFPNVRDVALFDNEVVFSAQSIMGDVSALIYSKQINGTWQEPHVISFSGQFFDIEPFFSKDGLNLYFVSNRPLNKSSSETKDFDIWYVTRTDINSEWSEPINFGAPINTDMDEFYPVITDSKNFYFTLDDKALNRKDDIYVSKYKNGAYTTPTPLGDAINSEGYEFNAFVAPDESFLVYTCYNREDGFGSGDLYISFRNEDSGLWQTAVNLGETINSNKMDYCPFVDIKTNTLYFTSKRNSTPNAFETKMNIDNLKEIFERYENGASRLYKIVISQN